MENNQEQQKDGLSEENVLQHILDKHVAPQNADPSNNEDSPEGDVEGTLDDFEGDGVDYEADDVDQAEGEDPVYQVTLPEGEIAEVTLEELKKGYSRTEDYTRKTMSASEKAKKAEQLIETVSQERQELLNQVDTFITDKEKQLKQAESIDMVRFLEEEGAEEAQKLRILIDDARRDVERAKALKTQELAKQQQLQQEKYQEYIQAQKTVLLKRIPDVADPKKAEAVFKRVNEALSSHGFSSEEINNATDARAIELAYKAAMWDEAQSKRKKTVEKVSSAPRFQRSGGAGGVVAKNAAKSQAYEQAYNNARSSGGDRSSVEALILQKFKD